MKSKLFVGTCLLAVGMSACENAPEPAQTADGGGAPSSGSTQVETSGATSHRETDTISSSGTSASLESDSGSSGGEVNADGGQVNADGGVESASTSDGVVTSTESQTTNTSDSVSSVDVNDSGPATGADASGYDASLGDGSDGSLQDAGSSVNTSEPETTTNVASASSDVIIDGGENDAGAADAGNDSATDAGNDSATDAGNDSATDAGNDSASDAGNDSGTDGTSSDTSSGDSTTELNLDGRSLFEEETFGGNGRTCLTCHTAATGTISPAEIQTLFNTDPTGPMFRPIDSDDGASDAYSILLDRATFRVEIPLPPGVTLVSDPTATSIVLRRSVPTTINTPALDPTLMWDGRASSLEEQALGAITGHAQSPLIPTQQQLDAIVEFEHGEAFFSSQLMRDYADGGAAPQWPLGVTAEEQRGRRWFAEDPVNARRFNICGQCHGGPMTNETQQNSGLPVGEHFQTANVSEFNTKGNPVYQFQFQSATNPGQTVIVTTPDPGLALTTGDVRDVNFFKIPPLWGINKTAPYFHDNSAATLEELMEHYEDHLATFLPRGVDYPRPHVPTAQDKADIIAYMKLL
jgi:hypothetical protein